jgi:hypothetical protein
MPASALSASAADIPVAQIAVSKGHVLQDGARVFTDHEGVEVRDPDGRLLVRYRDGVLEIEAVGDLALSAKGKLHLSAGEGVHVDAGPELNLRADRLHAEAKATKLVAGVVSLFARDVSTTATRAVQRVERWELTAHRIVEQAHDAFRDVENLAQQHVGRLRTIVDDVYSVTSRRTDMVSEDDTSIDGKHVLLG